MSGMTSERLTEVRARVELTREAAAMHFALSQPEVDRTDLLAHVDYLTAEVVRLRAIESGIEALHTRDTLIQCGVTAEGPHRHSRESPNASPPVRPLVCTEPDGHEGPHKDAICCWNFEVFTSDPPVVITGQWPMSRRDHSSCTRCRTAWPCETVALLNPPTEGETDEPA